MSEASTAEDQNVPPFALARGRQTRLGLKCVTVAGEVFGMGELPQDFVDDLGEVFGVGLWLVNTPPLWIGADGLKLSTATQEDKDQ